MFFVSDVVFYSADYVDLLPFVPHKNNRRKYYYDGAEPLEEVTVLDQGRLRQIRIQQLAERMKGFNAL
jgi:hypothetical protein